MESQLRQVSGAFAELLDERFGDWGLTRSERDVAWFTDQGPQHRRDRQAARHQRGHGQGALQRDLPQGRGQRADAAPEPVHRGPDGRARRAARPGRSRRSRSSRRRPGDAGADRRRRLRLAGGPAFGVGSRGGRGRGREQARIRYVMDKFEIGDLVVAGVGVDAHGRGGGGRGAGRLRLVPRGRDRPRRLRRAAAEEVGAPRGGRPAGARRGRRRSPGAASARAAASPIAPRGSARRATEQAARGKPGWDGKPREKKYFRKDG